METEYLRKIIDIEANIADYQSANTLVILYAPYATQRRTGMLMEKLSYYLERLGLPQTNVLVNPPPSIGHSEKLKDLINIVVGWGLPTKPDWDRWVRKYCLGGVIHHFLGFDLYERLGIDGRILDKPRVDAGKYWGQKVQESNLKLFLKGYYVRTATPYGMKRVQRRVKETVSKRSESYSVLMPGKPEEIQIVRLIFDLFVNHGYKRTDISNLLHAQGVQPPGRKTIWKSDAVSAILKNPVYIGANQHQDAIRYNVFPSVLDKFLFFEAQAKIMLERFPREVRTSIYHDCSALK